MRYLLITILLLVLLPAVANASEGALRVSIEGGAFNSKFKFFDASDGCPSYTDIPGAPDFLGGVFASGKGATKKLPRNMPVHVFLFRPRDTPGITAAGGAGWQLAEWIVGEDDTTVPERNAGGAGVGGGVGRLAVSN